MTRKGARIGHSDGLPKRSASGPKAIAWPLSSGRQELTSRSSYLYATAPLDRPVS